MDNLISPIVCIVSGSLQHIFGPKKVLMLNCFPYLFSWTLAVLAGFYKNVILWQVIYRPNKKAAVQLKNRTVIIASLAILCPPS